MAVVTDQDGPRVSMSGLAPNWTLTSCQDIAHDYAKDLKMDKMRYSSWYNNIIRYNNYSESVLRALVIEQNGAGVTTLCLAPDLILRGC